jgi:plasmid maintenance system antidote protein VapI
MPMASAASTLVGYARMNFWRALNSSRVSASLRLLRSVIISVFCIAFAILLLRLEIYSNRQNKIGTFFQLFYKQLITKLKTTTGERLEMVKNALNMTNLSLAEAMKTDNSTVGKIIKGKLGLTNSMLLELYSNYDIDINWLLTGNGEMFRQEKTGAEPVKMSHKKELQEARSYLAKLALVIDRLEGIAVKETSETSDLPSGKSEKPAYEDLRDRKKQRSGSSQKRGT